MVAWIVNSRLRPRGTSRYHPPLPVPFRVSPLPHLERIRLFLFIHLGRTHFATRLFSHSCMGWGVYVPPSLSKASRGQIAAGNATSWKPMYDTVRFASPKVERRNYDCENVFSSFPFLVLYLCGARCLDACARWARTRRERAASSRSAEKWIRSRHSSDSAARRPHALPYSYSRPRRHSPLEHLDHAASMEREGRPAISFRARKFFRAHPS